MQRPQLEGNVEEPAADEVTRLKRELAGAEREIQELRESLRKEQQFNADAKHAIGALKAMVEPIFKPLAMIMGEIKRVDVGEIPGGFVAGNSSSSIWQERIAKSSGPHARLLQILLDGGGGPMTYKQLRAASRLSGNTSSRLGELIAKNWVQKTGHGEYSLK